MSSPSSSFLPLAAIEDDAVDGDVLAVQAFVPEEIVAQPNSNEARLADC